MTFHAYNARALIERPEQYEAAHAPPAHSNGIAHTRGAANLSGKGLSSPIRSADSNGKGHRPGRLNLFQRLVRQWESLHPYNGVQILKLKGEIDLDLAREAWHDALEVLGLGRVCVAGDSYRYQCLNGDSVLHTVRLCPAGTSMERWITDEMNQPFDEIDSVPFRPFAIQENGHFWLGLVYQHWIADSASIRMLMHEWFVRQYDRAAATTRAVRTQAGGYLSLFGPHRAGWHAGEELLSALRWQSQFCRARRIEDDGGFRDMSARFLLAPTSIGLIDQLYLKARELKVTVNDIFLAAITEACDRYVPAVRRYRRQDLAIATIVDLRSKTHLPLGDVFDLLLGFTSVSCRPNHLHNWDTLLHAVASQTRRQKKTGAPQSSWLRMLGGLAAGRMLAPERILSFYRKRVSLAGANSNVNLNRCWAPRYTPDPLLDYIRVAPTGPMTPLVFTTTTLGHGLSIGLTYRSAIVPPEKAKAMTTMFVDRLNQVVGEKK